MWAQRQLQDHHTKEALSSCQGGSVSQEASLQACPMARPSDQAWQEMVRLPSSWHHSLARPPPDKWKHVSGR